MLIVIHQLIAGFGGMMFIMMGVERRRERRLALQAGKEAESPAFWNMLIFTGICLLIFSTGLMLCRINLAQL